MTRSLNGIKTVGFVSLHILTHCFSPLNAALGDSGHRYIMENVLNNVETWQIATGILGVIATLISAFIAKYGLPIKILDNKRQF